MTEEQQNPEVPTPPEASSAPEVAARTSGMAVTGLVFGILSVLTCGITSILALVFGIIGLVQTSKNRQTLKGWGMALTAVILGGVTIFCLPLLAIAIPNFMMARESARQAACMNNVKQLSVGMLMYSQDWDDRFPAPGTWNSAVETYVKNSMVFQCPSAKSRETAYAMNGRLNGLIQRDGTSPADTVMLFESKPGKNQSGGAELLPEKARHPKGHSIGFTDGHAMSREQADAMRLGWDPRAETSPAGSSTLY